MAPRPVVLYPDPRLGLTAEPVTVWDDGLRTLAQDIVDTMGAVSAIGLTAAHIGVLRRVVVLRLDPAAGPRVFVNPEVAWASDERASHVEGSVSMPGVTETVERPARVRVRYRDLEGAEREEEAQGFAAACLLHEIDQLDGIFWLERLSRLRRDRALKRAAKLRRGTMP
ncbi:MAG TPA: peptide deformylase [Microvirga sp.]|nr:peptide deformylase [Microvirga sp.]